MTSYPHAKSFGGGPLDALKLVRFIFLDEGGISQREPVVVVAGIFVHGDNQIVPLEEHLENLVHKHIPERDRDGFIFHAKDIWSGTKYFKNRDEWPIERRIPILEDLVQAPKILGIPIIFGFVRKSEFPRSDGDRDLTKKEIDIFTHANAFATCTVICELKMRERWKDEIAQMVVENNEQAKSIIKLAYGHMKNPKHLLSLGIDLDYLPLRRLRGSPQFADKADSKPLQIADVCAFFIRGFLSGHPKARQFYEVIRPQMLVVPKVDVRREDWFIKRDPSVPTVSTG